MKIILLRDVAKIGRRFEVKEVPAGHALNFLIPKKLAETATPENLRRLKDILSKQQHTKEVHTEQFEEALKKLTETPLTISVEANAQGSLFKGVHEDDIVSAAQSAGVSLSKNEIILSQPIKELGEHTVALQMGTRTGSIVVSIVKK